MDHARRIFALAVVISAAAITPAHAYLDPGTGSILLQAIIGGVAAMLFVVRGYIYRLKDWLGLVPQRADDNRQAGKQ